MGGTEAAAQKTRRSLTNAKVCLRAYLNKKPAFLRKLAKKVKAFHTRRESVDATYSPATLGMPTWEGLAVGNTQHAVEYAEDGEYLDFDEFGVWRMTSMEEASTYTTLESEL